MDLLTHQLSKLHIGKNKASNNKPTVQGATSTTVVPKCSAVKTVSEFEKASFAGKLLPTTLNVTGHNDPAILPPKTLATSIKKLAAPHATTTTATSTIIPSKKFPKLFPDVKIFTGKKYKTKQTYTIVPLQNSSVPQTIKVTNLEDAPDNYCSITQDNKETNSPSEPLTALEEKPQISTVGNNFYLANPSQQNLSNRKAPSVLLSNARSFNTQKIRFYEDRLQSIWTSVDILLISETWFASRTNRRSKIIHHKPPHLRQVKGFTGFYADRDLIAQNKITGGGAAIYLSTLSCSQPTVVFKEQTNIYEVLAVMFNFKNSWWLAVSFYIIPKQHKKGPQQDIANSRLFERILAVAKTHQAHFTTVIGGDFNKTYANLSGFTQVVNVPTRKKRILDLIYTDAPHIFKPVQTYRLGKKISDHLAVELVAL